MKKIVEKVIGFLVKIIIKKYRPYIIGVTGSVGKTSTKDAIYLVLKNKFFVRRSIKNYNNELGLPLTIINSRAGGKNIFNWLIIFFKAIGLIVLPMKFPKVLVLEMAADQPGDINYLTSLAPCQIGVLTAITPVHLEKFKSVENVLKEKQIMVTSLPTSGWAILNGDEEKIIELRNKIKAKILTFGFNEKNDVRALEVSLAQKQEENKLMIDGLRFKLNYQGKIIPFFLPGVIARHQLYSVLASVGVGIAMGLNLLEISESLKKFSLPVGRMNLIEGIKNSIIIDDSYNASPEATKLATETLDQINLLSGKRKIVVLGEMLELGETAEESHREVGRLLADKKIDMIITVGELSKKIIDSAKRKSFSEDKTFYFEKAKEAGTFLKDKIMEGDLILVKGSQGSRMEKVVQEIMAEPERAGELLVRQGKAWE